MLRSERENLLIDLALHQLRQWKVPFVSLPTSAPFLCLQAADEMALQRVWHGRGAKLVAAASPDVPTAV